MIVDVAIELIIPDNAAYTVLLALRGLGYAELARVERVDSLRLTVAGGASQAADTMRALSRAEVVFNPNKHRLSYSVVDDDPMLVDPPEYEASVHELEDETASLTRLLVGRFELHGLQDVRRGVVWRLYEGNRSVSAQRLEAACDALLSNPHLQSASIARRPVRRSL
ncbi:MAG: hypothetical protein GIW99_02975 [Candidatus Eremiobacteraeota bacterium]|nr:hypothetical protein [Candidatus Eremiobacteraeota bacterium]MBC5826635.1 hypothetical protein [Candidatus Eremiobacteraeota bacterium]